MTGNFRPRKSIRYLIAIMCITLLGSLSGKSILISDAEAETDAAKKISARLTELESELNAIKSDLSATVEVPVGTILPYGGPVQEMKGLEVKGWLFCDGRPLERQRYPELYQTIGFAYGKPDENSFNLPDLRGRFVRGVDHGAGRDPDAKERTADKDKKGGNIGDKVGSVQEDAFKTHMHTTVKSEHKIWRGKSKDDQRVMHPESVGGSETRPKNIYVNWIIKAKSVK